METSKSLNVLEEIRAKINSGQHFILNKARELSKKINGHTCPDTDFVLKHWDEICSGVNYSDELKQAFAQTSCCEGTCESLFCEKPEMPDENEFVRLFQEHFAVAQKATNGDLMRMKRVKECTFRVGKDTSYSIATNFLKTASGKFVHDPMLGKFSEIYININ